MCIYMYTYCFYVRSMSPHVPTITPFPMSELLPKMARAPHHPHTHAHTLH